MSSPTDRWSAETYDQTHVETSVLLDTLDKIGDYAVGYGEGTASVARTAAAEIRELRDLLRRVARGEDSFGALADEDDEVDPFEGWLTEVM